MYGFAENIKPIAEQMAEKNRKPIEIQDLGNSYRIEIPFEKARPKQTVFTHQTIFLISHDSFVAEAEITIYADNVPIPIKQTLAISCDATKNEGSLEEVLKFHEKNIQAKYSRKLSSVSSSKTP